MKKSLILRILCARVVFTRVVMNDMMNDPNTCAERQL